MGRLATGIELRAARAVHNWSRDAPSRRPGLSVGPILRHEASAGMPVSRGGTLQALIRRMERAGIDVLDEDGHARPGRRPPLRAAGSR